jgi:hypothetical protein
MNFLSVDCTMCGTSKCTSDGAFVRELVAGAFGYANDGDSAGFEENLEDSEVYVDVANIFEDIIITR